MIAVARQPCCLRACSALPSTKERSPRDSAAELQRAAGRRLSAAGQPRGRQGEARARREAEPARSARCTARSRCFTNASTKPAAGGRALSRPPCASRRTIRSILNNYAVYLCKTGRTEEGVSRFHRGGPQPLYETPAAAYTNAGVCLRAAKRLRRGRSQFRARAAIRARISPRRAYQLGELQARRAGEPADARAQIDTLSRPRSMRTPELLLLGVRAAQAQGDRLARGEVRTAAARRVSRLAADAIASRARNPG